MDNVGTDTAKLAGLQIDLLQKIRSGQVNLDHLEWFNKLTKKERDRLLNVLEVAVPPGFNIWKTIKLGLRKSAEDYRRSFEGKYTIGDYANQILGKISISQEEVEVDLVIVTGRDLGFEESARRDAIYDRAIERGLMKCPREVGPALREQYPDQPSGELILIGMDPIAASGGDLDVFGVGRDASALWLRSLWGRPGSVWSPGGQWVFLLPRKKNLPLDS